MPGRSARVRYDDLALLSTTNGSPRSPTRPRVSPRALPPRRHTSPMAKTAITPNIHQSLDVHSDFTPQVTLDPHFLVDDFANAVDLIVSQIPHARVRAHIRAFKELLAGVESNAEDIGQCSLDALVARKIDPCNSRHVTSP